MSSLLQWTNYNEVRRRTIGNELIQFYLTVGLVYASQSNPAIIVPPSLRSVFIRVETIGGKLVIFVIGFPTVARHIINDDAVQKHLARGRTVGHALLNKITSLGAVEHCMSASFRIRILQEKSQILNDENAEIAIFHSRINRLEPNVIRSVSTVYPGENGRVQNTTYRTDNTPGLYVNNRRYNSASALLPVIRKRSATVQAFVNELFERYYDQNPRGPVQDTLNGVTVVCKLASM